MVQLAVSKRSVYRGRKASLSPARCPPRRSPNSSPSRTTGMSTDTICVSLRRVARTRTVSPIPRRGPRTRYTLTHIIGWRPMSEPVPNDLVRSGMMASHGCAKALVAQRARVRSLGLGRRRVDGVGSAVTGVVLPLVVYQITGSAAQTGALFALRVVPYLMFGLVAGPVADRGNRRRLIIGGNLIEGALVATIPIADLFGVLTWPAVRSRHRCVDCSAGRRPHRLRRRGHRDARSSGRRDRRAADRAVSVDGATGRGSAARPVTTPDATDRRHRRARRPRRRRPSRRQAR